MAATSFEDRAGPMSSPMTSTMGMDQFLNVDALMERTVPLVAETDSNAINYAELFRSYFSGDLSKISPALPPLPAVASTSASTSSTTVDPSILLFDIPGSPIGAFSPSSDNSGQRYASLSPASFSFDLTGASDESRTDMLTEARSIPLPALDIANDPSLLNQEDLCISTRDEDIQVDDAPLKPIHEDAEAEVTRAPKRRTAATNRGRRAPPADVDSSDNESAATDADAHSQFGPARSARQTKLAKTSVAPFATDALYMTSSRSVLPPVPDWIDKPDTDTYKKMNSKEKRQLRNKISARNFRHRRKEYITTLEEEIATRDNLISQLRDEVDAIKDENQDLKSEVTVLKQKWDEMMTKITAGVVDSAPPSATGASTSSVGLGLNLGARIATPKAEPLDDWPLSDANMKKGSTCSSAIVKPNLNKDAPPTLARSSGSWTTTGFGGGYLPVHTTFVPEINLSAKPGFMQQNFNPALNQLSAAQQEDFASFTSHLRSAFADTPSKRDVHDSFFSTNPYFLRQNHVEEYRGQLYGKLANNAAGFALAHKMPGAHESTGMIPVPAGFRPAFFTSSRSNTFASASKELTLSEREQSEKIAAAFVANVATQTLFQRMSAAFVDAFKGSVEGQMSAEKVAAIVAGRSKLEVANAKPAISREVSNGGGLAQQLHALSLAAGATEPTRRQCAFGDVTKRWRKGVEEA